MLLILPLHLLSSKTAWAIKGFFGQAKSGHISYFHNSDPTQSVSPFIIPKLVEPMNFNLAKVLLFSVLFTFYSLPAIGRMPQSDFPGKSRLRKSPSAAPRPGIDTAIARPRPKVLYVYDALCGWCYGFSPVMYELWEKYRDSIDFQVISGGMVTGSRIGPIGEIAPFLDRAYKQVEVITGIRFGKRFTDTVLKQGTSILTSVQPAIAMAVFRSYFPDKVIPFAAALQRAIYSDGIESSSTDEYGQIAREFGIPSGEFIIKMLDKKFHEEAESDFEKAKKLRVNGFPAVFYVENGRLVQIAQGYKHGLELERALLNEYLATRPR
jgi:putative protein-disulfide isomerase